jgi:hypothetical protein
MTALAANDHDRALTAQAYAAASRLAQALAEQRRWAASDQPGPLLVDGADLAVTLGLLAGLSQRAA